MAPLEKRTLGRTGVDVTVLGFGAMELRGERHRNPRPLKEGQADRVLNAVLDAGVNFIDTSIDYGASESYIGNAISHRRDEYILASKSGMSAGRRTVRRCPAWSVAPRLQSRKYLQRGGAEPSSTPDRLSRFAAAPHQSVLGNHSKRRCPRDASQAEGRRKDSLHRFLFHHPQHRRPY